MEWTKSNTTSSWAWVNPALFPLEPTNRGVVGILLLLMSVCFLVVYVRIFCIIVKDKLFDSEFIYKHFLNLGVFDMLILIKCCFAAIAILKNSIIFATRRQACILGYGLTYINNAQYACQYCISLNRVFATYTKVDLANSKLLFIIPWVVPAGPAIVLWGLTDYNEYYFSPITGTWSYYDYVKRMQNYGITYFWHFVNYGIPCAGCVNYILIIIKIMKLRGATSTGGIGEAEKRVFYLSATNLLCQILVGLSWLFYPYLTFILIFIECFNAASNALLMVVFISKVKIRFLSCLAITANAVGPTSSFMSRSAPRS